MIRDTLKRWMPRSLYGRAALILVLPIVLLQVTVSIGFVQRYFEGVTGQMARSVVLELRLIADRLEDAPEEARALGAALRYDVRWPAPSMPAADSWGWLDLTAPTAARALRAGLPDLARVVMPDERTVRLWLETGAGPMAVEFDRQRLSASNPHQLLVLIVVSGALLALVAYIFLRNQLRPIRRLARAATEFGRGRVVRYTPTGATEVRAAGAAFLDMRHRIERQTQTRTMMLSGVSHDLRTPITRLRLELSMLDEEVAAPMLRDVDDMARMVDAFLDYARADADAGDARAPADAGALVRAAVEEAQRAGRQVELVSVTGEAGPVPLRPLAVARALDNLIGNALRHGSRAEVSLSYGERSLRITVEDDGPGIPPERREEAMRPFTRLDRARNQDRGPGVGLGLAIVSDIARAHGGSLRLGDSARLGGLRADLVLAR